MTDSKESAGIRAEVGGIAAQPRAAIEAFGALAAAFGGHTETFAKAPRAQRRAQRRADATERQARYEASPLFDRLAATASRRGESRRERERLLAAA